MATNAAMYTKANAVFSVPIDLNMDRPQQSKNRILVCPVCGIRSQRLQSQNMVVVVTVIILIVIVIFLSTYIYGDKIWIRGCVLEIIIKLTDCHYYHELIIACFIVLLLLTRQMSLRYTICTYVHMYIYTYTIPMWRLQS